MARDQKKARKQQATIVFADECGILMSPLVRRSWAPRGKTPILKQKTRSRTKISAMGALVATPYLRKVVFMFRLLTNQNFGADECVAFLRQLLANITGKIILVWDNFLPHKSVKVKNLINVNPRLSVEFLPPYAPELNPVEGVWSHLKMNKMANYCPRSLEDLEVKAKSSFCDVRKEKRVLKKIFHHALSKTC